MRIVKAAFVGAAATLVLAGCNRKEEPKAPAPAEAPAPAAQAPAKPAALPTAQRKPGLWEQRVSIADTVQVMRVCLDKATDAKLSWWGDQGARTACAKNLVTRQIDGTWRFSSVCDRGSGGVTTTSGVASGDFGSHYVVTADSSTTGAAVPQMNGEHRLRVDASRLGPCPAGMKGGDVELPGGMRVNILDLPTVP